MDGSWRHYTKWNKSDTNTAWFFFYEISTVVKLIEKVEWWFPGAVERGNGELLSNGYGVSVWKDEKVLEQLAGHQCEWT